MEEETSVQPNKNILRRDLTEGRRHKKIGKEKRRTQVLQMILTVKRLEEYGMLEYFLILH
jgi:hypothetical protein